MLTLDGEALVPDLAALVVLGLVTGGLERDEGLEDGVVGALGDGRLGAVDGLNGLGVGDGELLGAYRV